MTRKRKSIARRAMDLAHTARNDWSTCPRARVGAVVVLDGEIVKHGYNGAPPKQPHCDDVGCLIVDGHCVRTLHAEDNALWLAGRDKCIGADLYVTHFPCYNCAKLIVRAGIARVVYEKAYRVDDRAMALLSDVCEVVQFESEVARAK